MIAGQDSSKLETESTMDWRQCLNPILTVGDVAGRLNVTKDWLWDRLPNSVMRTDDCRLESQEISGDIILIMPFCGY
jgi:hypothetical protein